MNAIRNAAELTCMLPASLEQEHLLTSRILSPHARYYVREMRILAYAQILESYRSLTLSSLASSFGVSIDFVDRYVAVLGFVSCYSCIIISWLLVPPIHVWCSMTIKLTLYLPAEISQDLFLPVD